MELLKSIVVIAGSILLIGWTLGFMWFMWAVYHYQKSEREYFSDCEDNED